MKNPSNDIAKNTRKIKSPSEEWAHESKAQYKAAPNISANGTRKKEEHRTSSADRISHKTDSQPAPAVSFKEDTISVYDKQPEERLRTAESSSHLIVKSHQSESHPIATEESGLQLRHATVRTADNKQDDLLHQDRTTDYVHIQSGTHKSLLGDEWARVERKTDDVKPRISRTKTSLKRTEFVNGERKERADNHYADDHSQLKGKVETNAGIRTQFIRTDVIRTKAPEATIGGKVTNTISGKRSELIKKPQSSPSGGHATLYREKKVVKNTPESKKTDVKEPHLDLIKTRVGVTDQTPSSSESSEKKKMDPSRRIFREKQGRSAFSNGTEESVGSATGYAAARKDKMQVVHVTRGIGATKTKAEQKNAKRTGFEGPSDEEVRKMWLRSPKRAEYIKNAADTSISGGILAGGKKGKSSGGGIGHGAGKVVLIVAAIAGIIGSTLFPISHQLTFVPLAAHYYTNGEPVSDEDALERKNDILTGIYELLVGEEEKEIITQAAVNEMDEYQKSLGDFHSALGGALEGMQCLSITDRGEELSWLDEVSAKLDFENYSGDYTFYGVAVERSGELVEKPERCSESFRHTVFEENKDEEKAIRIIYHYGDEILHSTVKKYYSNGAAFSDGQIQLLGCDEAFSYDTNERFISGWSLVKGGTKIYDAEAELTHSKAQGFKVLYGGVVNLYATYTSTTSTMDGTVKCVTEAKRNGTLAEYFNEDEVFVRFQYEDAEGNSFREGGEGTPAVLFTRNFLYKTILGMATVASDNDYEHPEEYIEYCSNLLKIAIKTGAGYDVEYRAKTLLGTAGTGLGETWNEDGISYQADGVVLVPYITIHVNAEPDLLISKDDMSKDGGLYEGCKFKEWDQESIDYLGEYIYLSTEDFIDLFQVALPKEDGVGIDGGILAVYLTLLADGFTPQAAYGVMGNLAQESGFDLDPEAYNASDDGSIEAKGIYQDTQGRIDRYAAEHTGEVWPEICVETQTLSLCEALLSDWDTWDETVYDYYTDEYLDVSLDEFKACMDVQRSTVLFLCKFERPGGNYKAEADKRYAFAMQYQDLLAGTVRAGEPLYIAAARTIAEDDTHGYDQNRRNDYYIHGSEDAQYDCTSFVFYTMQMGGLPMYELNNMEERQNAFSSDSVIYNILINGLGYTWQPFEGYEGLPSGAVLGRSCTPDKDGHNEFYYGKDADGNHLLIGARWEPDMDETPGDQSGREISILDAEYFSEDYWDEVLIPPASMYDATKTVVDTGTLDDSVNRTVFVNSTAVIDDMTISCCDANYNDGLLASGMAFSSKYEPGTLIYVVTQKNGSCAIANGHYFIVTEKLEGTREDTLYLYYNAKDEDVDKAPFGEYKQAKIFVCGQYTWDSYTKMFKSEEK